MQLQDNGHNSESYSFGVMPLVKVKILSRMMAPERRENSVSFTQLHIDLGPLKKAVFSL